MIASILNFLTYALCIALAAGIIFGVIVFLIAACWLQSMETEERRPAVYEPKESQAAISEAAPAAQRRRRRAAQSNPT